MSDVPHDGGSPVVRNILMVVGGSVFDRHGDLHGPGAEPHQ